MGPHHPHDVLPIPFVTTLSAESEQETIFATCQVASECLEYALGHKFEQGIWGRISYGKRRSILIP